MTNTFKRTGAAVLSLILLCMLTLNAMAASNLTVGVKFWKERSDKESMADRKSTRLNSSHSGESRMPSSA